MKKFPYGRDLADKDNEQMLNFLQSENGAKFVDVRFSENGDLFAFKTMEDIEEGTFVLCGVAGPSGSTVQFRAGVVEKIYDEEEIPEIGLRWMIAPLHFDPIEIFEAADKSDIAAVRKMHRSKAKRRLREMAEDMQLSAEGSFIPASLTVFEEDS